MVTLKKKRKGTWNFTESLSEDGHMKRQILLFQLHQDFKESFRIFVMFP